jgi:colanic acid/amylovoran biosynthesis protein
MPLLSRDRPGSVDTGSAQPGLLGAVRQADLVVSSGGGFVNDTFWPYGAGVLSVLAMAQRLGKPTAMFGQGIGPLTNPLVKRLVKRAMPRLMVIGLREGVQSIPLLTAYGVDPQRIQVTGDDALLLATPHTRPQTGTAVGLNVRVATYSGIHATVGRQLVDVARDAAQRRGVTTVALPVEYNKAATDLQAFTGHEVPDIRTPEALAEHVARCRVVVTGSYHAAVYALAVGVPAVCITKSGYYDGKFKGLAALFPGGCQIVSLGPLFEHEVTEAIDRAWDIGESRRDRLHFMALAQVAHGDQLYERFKSLAAPRVLR